MPQVVGKITDYFSCVDGTDTISSSVMLGPTKFRDSQNINLFPVGGYSWRNGYTELNTSPVGVNACNGLHMARYTNGNIAVLVSGDKIYSMPANLNGTWTDRTNGITLSSGDSVTYSFALLNDILVGCNDTDTTFQMNNSLTVATLAGTPAFTSALFCVEHFGYMFYGQTVESATRQYDRLRFSDINAPNSFTSLGSNNYIDVALKTGGDLRGAVSYNGNFFAFKRHGIYQITFQPTQVNSSGTLFPFTQQPVPIVPNVGTQSHRSIVKFTTPITNTKQAGTEIVFFLDQFGIPRIFDGQTTVQIGYPISMSRDTTITSLSDMDRTQLATCWAVNYPERNQIWLFMAETSTEMDTCWVLDYTTGFAWTRHNFASNFLSGALFEKSDGSFKLFTGDYDGTVYEQDTGTNDNGVAIESYVVHGDAFNESPAINSKWLWIELKGTTGDTAENVSIDFYKDGEDSSSITLTSVSLSAIQTTWGTTGVGGTMTWGTSTWAKQGLITIQKDIGMDAKTVRVKISNSTLDNTLSLEGFSINSVPQGVSQV